MTSRNPSEEALRRAADALRRELDAADVDEHLDAEEYLIPYANGTLSADRKEIADSHVDDCAMCRAELDDLLVLRDTPRRRFGRWVPIAATAAAAAVLIAVVLLSAYEPEAPPARSTPVAATRPNLPPPAPVRVSMRPEWEQLVAETLRSGELPFPAGMDSLRPPRGDVRGFEDAPRTRLTPAGVVIRETRPRFTWPASKHDAYVVSVFDGERELARSPALTSHEWTPPHDLPRGRTLVWQVRAMRGEDIDILPAPPEPTAAFRIISVEDQHALDEAARVHPQDTLLRAVLLAKAGLRDEALAALAEVPAERAGQLRRKYGVGAP
ncbi:MAG TPA: hypothetical protein VF618_11170 [Thermoanaerobaculia bacterium]